MIVYAISFIISFSLIVLAMRTKSEKNKMIFAMAATIPFILISTFRAWTVGIDTWKNYWPAYESVALYGHKFNVAEYLSAKYSVGFSIIVLVLSHICTHPAILFALCATIITVCTYYIIIKYSKNPALSIFIFFFSGAFLLTLNGMRSYTALALIFYSFRFIKDRSLTKYLITVSIASLLHNSMTIFIILYPLYFFRINWKHIVVILISSVIMLPVVRPILSFLLAGTSFSNYFSGNVFIDPLLSMLIINSLLLILFMYPYKKCQSNQDYNFFLKLQTFSVIICILSFCLPQSYRIEQLIDYWQIISIPYIFHCIKSKVKPPKKHYITLLACVIAIFIIYFTRSFVMTDTNQVRDYTSILNNNK